MNVQGLVKSPSVFGPRETMDRLAAGVSERGMAVLARIDHAAAAATAGLELRPTEVLIFGNPSSGTHLMQSVQTIGIDLPLKALVWQDDQDRTWLAWNDPAWLATRHGVSIEPDGVLAGMTDALAALTRRATTRDMGESS
jgi:uncharacterized protein (DUF302 family)